MNGTNIQLANYIADAIRTNTAAGSAFILKQLKEIRYGYNWS